MMSLFVNKYKKFMRFDQNVSKLSEVVTRFATFASNFRFTLSPKMKFPPIFDLHGFKLHFRENPIIQLPKLYTHSNTLEHANIVIFHCIAMRTKYPNKFNPAEYSTTDFEHKWHYRHTYNHVRSCSLTMPLN